MSRGRRNSIIALCLFFVLVMILFDQRNSRFFGPEVANKHITSEDRDFVKYHNKSFKVVYIVDGDTIDIDVPDGRYEHTRIRLLGIDAPETKSNKESVMYFGQEATAFITKLALDKKVTVLLDDVGPTRGKYGRLLAHLRLDSGEIINEQLVSNGFVYADLRFKNDRFNRYVSLQEKAMRAGAGLWKEVRREQLPKWLQRERPGLLEDAESK